MYEIKHIIYKVISCISKYLIYEKVTFMYNAIIFSSLPRINHMLGTGLLCGSRTDEITAFTAGGFLVAWTVFSVGFLDLLVLSHPRIKGNF